jgi:hypothetical protein
MKMGVWQNLLRRKYLSNKPLTQVHHRPGGSHFWARLTKAKDAFFFCLVAHLFKLQCEEQVHFWKDVWLGDKPLSKVYPTLFRIVRHNDDTVVNVLGSVPLNVSFRRGLVNVN